MLIEFKKQTTETVEIKTPFYCKSNYSFYQITDRGSLITVGTRHITVWEADALFNKSSIAEALEASVECSADEFNQAFQNTVKKICKDAVESLAINLFLTETAY